MTVKRNKFKSGGGVLNHIHVWPVQWSGGGVASALPGEGVASGARAT